ncbi:MAG: hypothetical protein FJW40_20265 [Acidobacteria bacterium]|nr:hypothetical protein [Acidobacteriota bacterium]
MLRSARIRAAAGFSVLLVYAYASMQAPPAKSASIEVATSPRMPVRIYVLREGQPFRIQPVQAVLPVKSDVFYRDRLWLENPDPDVLEVICNDEYHYMLLKGRANFHLPPGRYTIQAYRGLFYTPVRQEFELKADEARTITLPINAWEGMRPEGWISADGHIHLTRTQRENNVFLRWLEAEDLNVANFLSLERFVDAAPQYAFGAAGEFGARGYTIRPGQETRNQGFGHVTFLGGDKLIRPMSTGKDLSTVPSDYPFHTLLFDLARGAGAVTGYAHFRGRPLNQTLLMDLALGKLAFLELFQFGVLTTEPWYELLNAGFRITGIAGSDFPVYLQRLKPYPRWIPLLGPERALVRKTSTATAADPYGTWARGVRDGNVVVTNGPMVELKISGGTATATAAFFRPLELLEIVRNGEVVASKQGDGSATRLTLRLDGAKDGWWAARVRARKEQDEPEIQAHTNPQYPGGAVMIASARRAVVRQWEEELERYRAAPLVFGSPGQRGEFFAAGERALAVLKQPLQSAAER